MEKWGGSAWSAPKRGMAHFRPQKNVTRSFWHLSFCLSGERNPAFSCSLEICPFWKKAGFLATQKSEWERNPAFSCSLEICPFWKKAGFLATQKSEWERNPAFSCSLEICPLKPGFLPPNFFVLYTARWFTLFSLQFRPTEACPRRLLSGDVEGMLQAVSHRREAELQTEV